MPTAMPLPDVRYEVDAAVATITLDRPEARNAYSEEMVESLVRALDAADGDDAVRAVILTGAGKAFCAGGDLKRMQQQSGMFEGGPYTLRRNYQRGIHTIPERLARFEKPVIAAVNGPAMGAGLDLACMCDVRVAARSARFGSSFINVGLVPGDGGAYFLTRTIGFPRALEMMLTGRVVESEEALAMGLTSEVVDDDALIETARRRARAMAERSPIALRLVKRAAYQSLGAELAKALELAATYQGIAQNSEDHREALTALLEKRPPRFDGR
jgi:enoyl-CoA hydratase/carnithine racemase